VMEAYWTRFMPWCRKLREVLQSGDLGDIHHVTCDFSIQFDPNEAKRIFDPALCGGALLDVGIYPLSITSMIYGGGAPQQIVAVGDLLDTGVDGHIATTLRYGKNRTAQLFCGALADGPSILSVIGSKGRVTVHDEVTGYWHCSPGLTVALKGKDGQYHTEEFVFPKPKSQGQPHTTQRRHANHSSSPLPPPLMTD
jgi:predicted dehydrogenase